MLISNRDYVHIQSNPEVQWQLKRIKEEEKQLEMETRKMYNDQKRQRRLKCRDYNAKKRLKNLVEMNPEDRTLTIERIRDIKRNQHQFERALFYDQVKKCKQPEDLNENKVNRLKRLIRADYIDYRNLEDDGYDSFEGKWLKGPSSKEEKMYYGSDSYDDTRSIGVIEQEIEYNKDNKDEVKLYQDYLFRDWKRKNNRDLLVKPEESSSEEVSYYDEEDMEFSEGDLIFDEDGPDEESSFIEEESSAEPLNTSNSSSQNSKAVIEFDE